MLTELCGQLQMMLAHETILEQHTYYYSTASHESQEGRSAKAADPLHQIRHHSPAAIRSAANSPAPWMLLRCQTTLLAAGMTPCASAAACPARCCLLRALPDAARPAKAIACCLELAGDLAADARSGCIRLYGKAWRTAYLPQRLYGTPTSAEAEAGAASLSRRSRVRSRPLQ